MELQNKRNKNHQINIVLNDVQKKPHGRKNVHYLKHHSFKEIDDYFSQIIGLEKLRKTLKEIYATIIINEKRKEIGLKGNNQVLHMLFKGNPGTGKTTVARNLAKLYFDLNLLSKGHFIEVERADLVGEYIGQTAQKTRNIIQKAMGGVLFIDEAYSLARGGEKDFGKEAIDTLVKHMEDYHNDFVLILAGYPYEMERFLQLNPGLRSRFPFILNFDDYTVSELMEIAKLMLAEREYRLTKEAEWELRNHLNTIKFQNRINFSNARYVRNLIEHAIRMQSIRIVTENAFHPDSLMEIKAEDIKAEELDRIRGLL